MSTLPDTTVLKAADVAMSAVIRALGKPMDESGRRYRRHLERLPNESIEDKVTRDLLWQDAVGWLSRREQLNLDIDADGAYVVLGTASPDPFAELLRRSQEVRARLLDSEEHAGESAIPEVAEDAETLLSDMEMALQAGNFTAQCHYRIRHVDGKRYRTLDSIGMPDWTEDPEQALTFTVREHADRFSEEDPEDVRIIVI